MIWDGLVVVGYIDVVILVYVVKFVLVFYGLFCEVVSFSLFGDWCIY